jgi:hypothetical protein
MFVARFVVADFVVAGGDRRVASLLAMTVCAMTVCAMTAWRDDDVVSLRGRRPRQPPVKSH